MNFKNPLLFIELVRPSMRCVHVWPRAAKTEKYKYKSIDMLNWPDHGTGCQRVSLAMVKVKETFQSWLGIRDIHFENFGWWYY